MSFYRIENLGFKLLRLPPEPQKQLGWTIRKGASTSIPEDGGDDDWWTANHDPMMMGTFDEDWYTWHSNYPRRGVVFDRVLRQFRRISYWWHYKRWEFGIVGRLQYRFLTLRRLRKARKLRYESWIIPVLGATTQIDGHLNFEPNEGMTLDIACAGDTEMWAKEAWDRNDVQTGEGYGSDLGPVTIVLPGQNIDPEMVQEAIQRWYVERYKYSRRHWTAGGRFRPEVEVNIPWQTAAEAEAEYAKYSNQEVELN